MKRHSLDAVSLVFGLVFLGLGLAFLAAGADIPAIVATYWPVALVLLGLAILLSPRRLEAREQAAAEPEGFRGRAQTSDPSEQ